MQSEYRLLLYLCFGCLILSCENEASLRYDPEKVVTPTTVDNLILRDEGVDTLSVGYGLLPAYLDYQVINANDTNKLIGLNSDDFSLDFFDLDSQSSLSKLVFENQGPNGIKGQIDGFYYHNPDTIFLLTIDENRIYLMNSQAKVVDVFDFNNNPLPDGFSDYDAYADQGLQNGPYYVPSQKTLQFYTYRWLPEDKDDFNYHAFASYSIEDRTFTSTYGAYPENYQKGTNFLIYNDPGLLVIDTLSFTYTGASSEVHCYNNKTGELIYVSNSASEHWPGNPTPLKSLVNDFQKEQDWLIENAAYIFMIDGKKDGLIYRFLKHKQPITNTAGLANARWFGKWSITMHRKKDFQQVGSFELQPKTFFPIVSFATDKHLWIKSAIPESLETEAFYHKLSISHE